MKVKTSKSIWIDEQAWLYLKRTSRSQRGCKPLTEEQEQRLWNKAPKNKNGLFQVWDETFGGGDGTYNGRWWSWKTETVCEMLEEKGYQYTHGDIVEYINM